MVALAVAIQVLCMYYSMAGADFEERDNDIN
jgi:hypothetical protein